MDMQGSRFLAISQQQAWDALNDPEILKICIPGCDSIEVCGEHEYNITNAIKIGPVGAKFRGKIALADIDAPHSYSLVFEGQGGAAGFGKGQAKVTLVPGAEGTGCELGYTVHASVGGKIAQVGQRLIDGVARSMAEDFFRRFDTEMQHRHPELTAVQVPAETEAGKPSAAIPLWVWGVVVAAAAAAAWLLLR